MKRALMVLGTLSTLLVFLWSVLRYLYHLLYPQWATCGHQPVGVIYLPHEDDPVWQPVDDDDFWVSLYEAPDDDEDDGWYGKPARNGSGPWQDFDPTQYKRNHE